MCIVVHPFQFVDLHKNDNAPLISETTKLKILKTNADNSAIVYLKVTGKPKRSL